LAGRNFWQVVWYCLRVKQPGEGEVHRTNCHEGADGEYSCTVVQLYSCTSTFSLTLAPDRRRWLTPGPGRLSPWNDPIPTAPEAGWATGPAWTGAENLVSTGVRSPDCAARTVSVFVTLSGQTFIKSQPYTVGNSLLSLQNLNFGYNRLSNTKTLNYIKFPKWCANLHVATCAGDWGLFTYLLCPATNYVVI
jgi:hypothetical protein